MIELVDTQGTLWAVQIAHIEAVKIKSDYQVVYISSGMKINSRTQVVKKDLGIKTLNKN